MTTNNEMLAEIESYTRRYGRSCKHCGQTRLPRELNYEALVHHGATQLECIDRHRCERTRRRRWR